MIKTQITIFAARGPQVVSIHLFREMELPLFNERKNSSLFHHHLQRNPGLSRDVSLCPWVSVLTLSVIYIRTIILPVVLYGCETWSLTLREKHRLRVFENRVLRRIFGPKRDAVTGEWRKLHNEELNDL